MASVSFQPEPCCSICKNMFTDLMTLNCGHDYCRECITKVLDTQEKNDEDYCCPTCRKRFRSRPELQRFKRFMNNAESFELRQPDISKDALSFEPGQPDISKDALSLEPGQPDKDRPKIFCKNCIGHKRVAVKSCLHCEDNLCEGHLKVHSTSPEHVLADPTNDFKARKCSTHNKILDYYCTEDAAYICQICMYHGHQGHKVDKMEEAFKKMKKEEADIERKLDNLYEQNLNAYDNQTNMTKKVDELFRNIRKQLEELQEKVLNEINRQVHRSSISDQIQELELKKGELMSRIQRIEKLCNVTDQINWALDGGMEEGPSPQSENYQQEEDFLIPMILHAGLSDILKMKDSLFPDLHVAGITLDEKTAAKDVKISEDLKTATSTSVRPEMIQKSPKGKFLTCRVLSNNTISSGKRYWVVESSPSGNWAIGICYHSMKKGQGCIGQNDKSWGIKKTYEAYYERHKGKAKHVIDKVSSNKFGVFVDYDAGRLSIYALSNPVKHLCTFTPNKFNEAIHAVFSVGEDDAPSQLTVL